MPHAFTPRRLTLFGFALAYTVGFYFWFVMRGNGEFIWYLLQMFGFIILGCVLVWRVHDFPDGLLALIILIGLLHVMGGGVPFGSGILYGAPLLELYEGPSHDLFILKYDQLVHLLGFGAGALAARHVLGRIAPAMSISWRSFFAIFTAAGLGALNEISEFAAVVLFERTYVGGYYNLALDLSFNLLGALAFVLLAELFAWFKKSARCDKND